MSELITPLRCVRSEYRCDTCGAGLNLGKCYPLVEFIGASGEGETDDL